MGRAPVADKDFSGRLIDNGRLKLLESLGSGAYGKVYRALDTTSPPENPVYYAVKCLLKPEPGSHDDRYQFREYTLHKKVSNHPNIVTLHKSISDESYVYVILDLCDGGDLFTAIIEKDIFHGNVQLVKDSFVQLIDAVHFCHQREVYHRDIKPENVLCSADGTNLRLADFGLSTQRLLVTDFGCGSAHYMSPECVGDNGRNTKFSTRHCDIWALGIILANMVTGRNPWHQPVMKDGCYSAYYKDRDFLLTVLPISRSFNDLLKRILHLNPLCRITLPELRREILKIDNFYMTEEELVAATLDTRGVTAYTQDVLVEPYELHHLALDNTLFEGESTSSDGSGTFINLDELYTFGGPDYRPLLVTPATPVLATCPQNVDGLLLTVPSTALQYGSSSSVSESDGPVTPATHAIDPTIEVPDLPEGQSLDQPAIFSQNMDLAIGTQAIKIESQIKPKKRFSRHFRMAFQRLKALSSGSRSKSS